MKGLSVVSVECIEPSVRHEWLSVSNLTSNMLIELLRI